MGRLALLLSLPPVLRGLAAMALCGATFPLCGVAVLRLDLVPLRYTLMHGVLLGGALAMALGLPVAPAAIAANLLLVLLLVAAAPSPERGLGAGSAAAMVVGMALASLVMHVAGVPAKDALELLWGSPFALGTADLAALALLAAALVLAALLRFQSLLALFFNADIAQAAGVPVRRFRAALVAAVAIVVAAGMKLLGAFLVDAALLLPVLCATALLRWRGRAGIRSLCRLSCALGFVFCVAGYLLAVAVDWPPAATVGLLGGAAYLATLLLHR